MALTVGFRLVHDDVTALVDVGGMGQIYQATDTTLNRQGALKFLEAFATDSDRRVRVAPRGWGRHKAEGDHVPGLSRPTCEGGTSEHSRCEVDPILRTKIGRC